MFLKEILNLFFLLPVFANDYFVVRRIKISVNDIIKYIESQSLTSCYMKCVNNPKCVTIGLHSDPDLYVMNRCYLLKKRKQNKNGGEEVEARLLFVLVEVIPFLFLDAIVLYCIVLYCISCL